MVRGGIVPGGMVLGGRPYHPAVTHACENNTFRQLRWQTVKRAFYVFRKSRKMSRGKSLDRSISRKKSLAKRVSVVELPKKEVAGEKLIQEEKSQQGQV